MTGGSRILHRIHALRFDPAQVKTDPEQDHQPHGQTDPPAQAANCAFTLTCITYEKIEARRQCIENDCEYSKNQYFA